MSFNLIWVSEIKIQDFVKQASCKSLSYVMPPFRTFRLGVKPCRRTIFWIGSHFLNCWVWGGSCRTLLMASACTPSKSMVEVGVSMQRAGGWPKRQSCVSIRPLSWGIGLRRWGQLHGAGRVKKAGWPSPRVCVCVFLMRVVIQKMRVDVGIMCFEFVLVRASSSK